MEIILRASEIPPDLMDFFEPVSFGAMPDVISPKLQALHEKHYAAYPPELCRPFIELGTSAKGVCPVCRMPWVRILDVQTEEKGPATGKHAAMIANGYGQNTHGSGWRERSQSGMQTLGWKPSCTCPPHEPIQARVLDPFCGAATTLLVALRLGRDAVGVELSENYVQISKRRLVEDSPLFNRPST